MRTMVLLSRCARDRSGAMDEGRAWRALHLSYVDWVHACGADGRDTEVGVFERATVLRWDADTAHGRHMRGANFQFTR
jgi:hypothetical protein